MHKMTLAGAVLFAATVMAVPMIAWSAADDLSAAQQAAPQAAAPDQPGAVPMPHRGWMHRGRGMPRPGMMAWMHHAEERSPQQACLEHVARRVGFAAYVGAKLNLTAEQKPLWDKLQAAMQPAVDA